MLLVRSAVRVDDPALRIVMLEKFLAADVAEHHALGNPQLLRTYITPHVASLKSYGFRAKRGVSTRFIMNSPVGTAASADSTMAV